MLIPRSYQFGFCHQLATEAKRHFLEIWPRQHGKDRCFVNAAAQVAMRRPMVLWHCFPEYAQGRKAIWENIDGRTGKRILDDLAPLIEAENKQEMTITFKNGSLYRVVGSDNYNAVVGAGPYIIGYSEWARCDPMARSYFQPMLLQNGGIEVFMSTVFGENHCTAMADAVCNDPAWHYSFYTIDDTVRDAPGEDGSPVVSQEDLDELRREWVNSGGESGMSPEMIAQEYYNDRTGVNTGVVFGEELRAARNEGRITRVPHDPSKLVHTFWDRGVHNRIWFGQKVGPRWHLIDCLGTDLDALPGIIRRLREGEREKYDYGVHIVARDAVDPVPGHMQSFKKQAEALGVAFKIAPNLRVDTGINAARAVFPLCWFDEERCRPGLAGLGRYHYAWDDKKRRFSREPVHDDASHWADAFRYFAVGRPDAKDWREEDDLPPGADIITRMQHAQRQRSGNTVSRNYRRR
jgi:hypothetical protein